MPPLSKETWTNVISQSSILSSSTGMWWKALNLYGSVNIVDIIGVRDSLMQDFGGNYRHAFSNPVFINLVQLRIDRHIEELRRSPNAQSLEDRVNLLIMFRMHLRRDRDWIAHYADLLQNGLADAILPANERVERQPLRDAIRNQIRRPGPAPRPRNQQGPFCTHCRIFGHYVTRCQKAGTVRTIHGQKTALGEYPKCFACSIRSKKISDTVFHNSDNCVFVHPLARTGLKRKCGVCGWMFKRCWNCAEAVCLHRGCRGFTHSNSSCPHPRYEPLSQPVYGNATARMNLKQRLAALGILRLPRELCFLRNIPQEDQSNSQQQNHQEFHQRVRSASQANHQEFQSASQQANIQQEQHSNRGQNSQQRQPSLQQFDQEFQSSSQQAEMQQDPMGSMFDNTENVMQILEEEIPTLNDKDLCICVDELEIEELVVFKCGHRMHSDCYSQLKKQNCPYCNCEIIVVSKYLPAGAVPRHESRYTQQAATDSSFYFTPDFYQDPNGVQINPEFFIPADNNEEDPPYDVAALLLHTIDILNGSFIARREFDHFRVLSTAVQERGIDWEGDPNSIAIVFKQGHYSIVGAFIVDDFRI